MMTSPLFSIITITYNNLDGLKKTSESVRSQTWTDYEWIIIDGASEDGTLKYLDTLDISSSSEPDHGIYDAMNKGLDRATGTYVLFMNAGDTFSDHNILHQIQISISEEDNPPDFIYGDAIEVSKSGSEYFKPAHKISFLPWGMITHHQAMIYKYAVLDNLRYDLNHKIASDYAFTCRALKKAKSTLYINKPICRFEQGGISQQQARLARIEQFNIRRDLNISSPMMNLVIFWAQTFIMTFRRYTPRLYWTLRTLKRSLK